MTNLETIIQDADISFFETETFEKERNVFMNNLWGSAGKTITTPLGVGVIEEVRTQAGIDFQVRVKIPNIDGFTLFSGLKLFEEKSVIS